MKTLARLFALLLALAPGAMPVAQTAIGEWADHNSFVGARKVCVTPSRVYAATRMSLFYYDRSDSASYALTKVKGLSDVGISTIAYDTATSCLAVAYVNSGLDLIVKDQVYHIADIRYGNIGGDKKVYNIRFNDSKAYLATGFGIVVVDINRHEITETYYLGTNGETDVVYDIAFNDSLIFAGTSNGFMYAPKTSPRLHIYETWQRDTIAPTVGQSVRMLEVYHNNLIAAASNENPDSLTVYVQVRDNSWDTLGKSLLKSLIFRNGLILVNRFDSIELYNTQLDPEDTINVLPKYGMAANDVDMDTDGSLWIGHTWAGLVRLSPDRASAQSHAPQGPASDDYVYSLSATSSKLYLCPGGKKPTFESAHLPGSISFYENGQWAQVTKTDSTPFFQDVLYMAVDPKNRNHFSATSWGHGVLDVRNNIVETVYSSDNSDGALIPFTNGDFSHLRVSGLAYDDQGNLWITNSLVDRGLVVHYRDGSWKNFDISTLFQGVTSDKREIDKLIWDSVTDYKWFIGNANRIYVHDGVGKMAIVNPNNGSKLETHTVTALVQDRSGDIWFGTDKGLKVIYDGYRAFANGGNGETSPVNCSNILYNEDGINEYLMAYESISCIAVDGANRKWVGTSNNGLYLISANGLEQIHHFTAANSPLSSDKILTLAVHPSTGEVFIGTDMGLQSYRSTATVAYAEPMADIHAFPNPVRPGYDGPIAIKGFTRDALVHVTDVRGHVVFATTAFGGQAVWNGCNQNGQPVVSGTYFVFASDSAGNMRSVTKILIVR